MNIEKDFLYFFTFFLLSFHFKVLSKMHAWRSAHLSHTICLAAVSAQVINWYTGKHREQKLLSGDKEKSCYCFHMSYLSIYAVKWSIINSVHGYCPKIRFLLREGQTGPSNGPFRYFTGFYSLCFLHSASVCWNVRLAHVDVRVRSADVLARA